jgi:hypothetical protein
MAGRKAVPPSAAVLAQREDNRSGGRHAAPPEHAKHAAPGALKRWYYVVGSKAIFGHKQGAHVELELTDAQANVLMDAGHIAPADPPAAPVAAPAATTAPESADPGPVPAPEEEVNEANGPA